MRHATKLVPTVGSILAMTCGAASAGAGVPTQAFWRAIPGGGPNRMVNTLYASERGLLAGGTFFTVAGQPISNAAALDAAGQWSEIASPLDGPVLAFLERGPAHARELFAAGLFFLPNPAGVRTVARLQGGAWVPLPGSPAPNTWNGWLASFDDGTGEALHTSGGWDIGGGMSYVARWNGASWAALGLGLHTTVQESVEFAGAGAPRSLWTAGGLVPVEVTPFCTGLARWDGAWHCVGGGLVGIAYSILVFDDGRGEAIYVGGSFPRAGSGTLQVDASNVARWDGTHWEPLGAGLSGGEVRSVRVFDDGTGPAIFAAGAFSSSAGVPTLRVAKWNGSSWAGVDGGLTGSAETMAVWDPDGPGPASAALAVGGQFTAAGVHAAQNIALLIQPPPACAGDVSGDSRVDTADLAGLLGVFGRSFLTGTRADLNASGAVDTEDLVMLLAAFGQVCGTR